jgi:hypothetical protein
MRMRQMTQCFAFFLWLAGLAGQVTHGVKIRNGLIVFGEQHPDEAPPLIDRQALPRVQCRRDALTHREGLGVERNSVLVGVGLPRFLPGFAQVDKRFLPHFPVAEVVRQGLVPFGQPLLVQHFHGSPDRGMQLGPSDGQEAVIGNLLRQDMLEGVDGG